MQAMKIRTDSLAIMSYENKHQSKSSNFSQRRTPRVALLLLIVFVFVGILAYSHANKNTSISVPTPSKASALANLSDTYSSSVLIAGTFSGDIKNCKNVGCINSAAANALSAEATLADALDQNLYPSNSFYTFGVYQNDIVSLQKFYLAVGEASTTTSVLNRVAAWKQLLVKTKFDCNQLRGLLK